ncbi:polysaccharide monooxygenase [Podospora fimiseda]|uniref:lytic cellulose monooxygenase (C4-dehydrogenating) n=1 Tax=Podospora fimiseda TaxID=252190 RepID=A0AAN7H6Y6_9PEZI|nr:polysaccharide monooxygenase [Podospora fimiseda]
MSSKTSTILASLAGAALVAAHGHVSHVIINGVQYRNYNPSSDFYQSNPPPVLGWSALNQDNGFVEPNNFGTSDIICHKGSAPGKGYATIQAGDKINLVWNPEWPASHVGPVIDYLANCNGPCDTVDKSSLRWFKIGGAGYDSANREWAAETLIKNGNSWLVQIPADLKAGNYVLRHEIIALHGGPNPNGAQAYPQCLNFRIEGGGNNSPAGVPATSFYRAADPGILFNPFVSNPQYPVPGPALIPGVPSSIAQSTSVATRTASATVGGATAPVPPVTTSAAAPVTTTARPTSTLVTSTTAAPVTTAPSTGPAQSKWGQCGGNGWTGPTVCVAGSTCSVINDWYHQCV